MAKKRRRRTARGPGIVATLRDPDKIRVAYIIAGLALIFGGSLGFGASRCDRGTSRPGSNTIDPVTEVIAKIEDHEITYYEYSRDFEMMKRNVETREGDAILRPPEFWAEQGYRVLRQMIDMEYFDIRAREEGIEITEEQIDEKVGEYRTMLLPPQVVKEDRSLLERLSDALQGVKEDKAFADRLLQIDPTLTPSRLREITHQEILAQQYVAQLQAESEQEIITELSGEANMVRDEIIDGIEFADAARERSDHQSSNAAGGFIPMVKHGRSDLPQQVVESAFSLPMGEVSLPIIVTHPEYRGVWLLTVTSRKDAGGDDWLAAREEIGARLLDEKRQQVEQGIIQMPEDGNLTVTEEEKINEYEEADIRVIYFQAEDPMGRVQQFVMDDQDTMTIIINDSQLRAMQHMVKMEWESAAVSYYEALQKNFDRFNPDLDNQYAIDMGEANLRYLLGYLWMNRAFSAESEWLQNIWQVFQADPDAFGGEFPETPENIKAEQQGYFALSAMNFTRAVDLEDMDPWPRVNRVQIDLRREQVSMRVIEDLETAHEFSSNDYDLEQRVLGLLNQLAASDDKALEAADNIRPEVWEDPILPETMLGLTLENLDAPFFVLLETLDLNAAVEPLDTEDEISTESETSGVELEIPIEQSVTEDEHIFPEEMSEESGSETTEESQAEEPVEIPEIAVPPETDFETPGWLPYVPIPEPTGPLTQELRDRVDELLSEVQAIVDILDMQRQEQEAQRQAMQQQQFEQLPVNPPETEEVPPSEDAENLLVPSGESEPDGE